MSPFSRARTLARTCTSAVAATATLTLTMSSAAFAQETFKLGVVTFLGSYLRTVEPGIALTLPVSASARNRRNWRKVIFIDFYLCCGAQESILRNGYE